MASPTPFFLVFLVPDLEVKSNADPNKNTVWRLVENKIQQEF
jgi:hypothetical protein